MRMLWLFVILATIWAVMPNASVVSYSKGSGSVISAMGGNAFTNNIQNMPRAPTMPGGH